MLQKKTFKHSGSNSLQWTIENREKQLKNEKAAPDSYKLYRQVKCIKYIIGLQVKEARLKKGISQMELAMELDLDQNYISKIENGKVNISVESLYKICYYLDCYIRVMEKPEEKPEPIKLKPPAERFEYVL